MPERVDFDSGNVREKLRLFDRDETIFLCITKYYEATFLWYIMYVRFFQVHVQNVVIFFGYTFSLEIKIINCCE